MVLDSLHRQIVAGLAGQLDPEGLERCVNALLREVFSNLSWVQGGNDAGMDGVITDSHDSNLPLIATTAKNVISNLRRSGMGHRAGAVR